MKVQRIGGGWGDARNIACLLACLVAASGTAAAQPATWSLVADGDSVVWTPTQPWPADSVGAAARDALQWLQRSGHVRASVDSFRTRPGSPPTVTLFATRGPAVQVQSVRIEGLESLQAAEVTAQFATQPGSLLDPEALERDLDGLLDALGRAGRPLARAEVETALQGPPDAPSLALLVRVDEGDRTVLQAVALEGARRSSGAFAARAAGLSLGAGLDAYDPSLVQARLAATGLYDEVGTPVLVLGDSGRATLRIPVRERAPGAFDVVLGYLPADGSGQPARLVGNGTLVLRNPIGGGRVFSLRLIRNPGLVSRLDVLASDPFFLGLPLRAQVEFEGYNQDSTFARQRYGLLGGLRLAPGLELTAEVSRETVEAGPAGARIVDGEPLIDSASALFGGIGVRYQNLDRPLNPRRGVEAQATVQQGRKQREGSEGSEAPLVLSQQRLRAHLRLYVPTFERQALVAGAEAAVLLSSSYDESDLIRYGGAQSLRGYDEDELLGNAVGRGLVEYRYLLDPTSFAFAFFDLGFQARPEVRTRTALLPPLQKLRPGYGFGVQVQTGLGLVLLSYALNPADGVASGKIHVGLSVGL